LQVTRNALVVAALGLLLLFAGAASSEGRASAAAPHGKRFLWGAWIGRQFTGGQPPWDWRAVTEFEAKNAGGRHLSIVHWGVPAPWEHRFRDWVSPLNRVRKEGAFSLVDMDTESVPLSQVASGTYDSSIRAWAEGAKAWRHPFFLRFDWEMNGDWFPWGTTSSNQNTPADFVAAWRHVHDIFVAAGARNVRWVWCPNVDPHGRMTNLASLYPGRAYVAWTCLDGYNNDDPWMSFAKLYGSSYRQIRRLAPTKPMIVGEIASTEHGGDKALWISQMFGALRTRFSHIEGLVWYDKWGTSSTPDWPIETSGTSSAAFRAGIDRTLARACRLNAVARCARAGR
jgi:Glycosyl hydrolase family 26